MNQPAIKCDFSSYSPSLSLCVVLLFSACHWPQMPKPLPLALRPQHSYLFQAAAPAVHTSLSGKQKIFRI